MLTKHESQHVCDILDRIGIWGVLAAFGFALYAEFKTPGLIGYCSVLILLYAVFLSRDDEVDDDADSGEP